MQIIDGIIILLIAETDYLRIVNSTLVFFDLTMLHLSVIQGITVGRVLKPSYSLQILLTRPISHWSVIGMIVQNLLRFNVLLNHS